MRLISWIKYGFEAVNFSLEEILLLIPIHMFKYLLLHLVFRIILAKLLLEWIALVLMFLEKLALSLAIH